LCEKLASAAWLIEHKDDWRIACSGHTPVLGLPVDVNAYRAELHGIHAVLMVIKAICLFYGVTQGSVDLYYDCNMTLWLASKEWLQPKHGAFDRKLGRKHHPRAGGSI